MAGRKDAQQVVKRGADIPHVDLDVRERGRPERDHDVPRAGSVRDAIGERQPAARVDAVEDLLGARLGERHAAFPDGAEARGVIVDPDSPKATVGERERQRQPHAA